MTEKKSCYRREAIKGFKGEIGFFKALIRVSKWAAPLILPPVATLIGFFIFFPNPTDSQILKLILFVLTLYILAIPMQLAQDDISNRPLYKKIISAYIEVLKDIVSFGIGTAALIAYVIVASIPTVVPVGCLIYGMQKGGMGGWSIVIAVVVLALIVMPINYSFIKCSKILKKIDERFGNGYATH